MVLDGGHRIIVMTLLGGMALSLAAATHSILSRYVFTDKIRHPTPLADMAGAIKKAEDSRKERFEKATQ